MSTQQTHLLGRRTLLAAAALGAIGRRASAQAPAPQDPWPSLAAQIFDGRTVQDGSAVLAIDAPYRAEDAALVPVGIRSLLASRRRPPHSRHHAGDRRKSLAAGRRLLARAPPAACGRCPRGSASIPTPTCMPWPN